jgi:stage II sporulation protein D
VEYLNPKDGDLPKSLSPQRLRAEWQLLFVFLSATFGLLLFCTFAKAAPIPIVRVMVEREKQSIRIEGFDLVLDRAETGRNLASENRRSSVTVKCSLGGNMELGLTRGRKLKVNGPLHVSSMGGFIRVGQSQFRDDLYVYSFNGDCIVVNHLDLEKYIAGLLNSEMNAKWSLATLMAQAVAARTYAIYQMKEATTTKFKGLRPPFDLESTVRDQVYEGAHQERYKAIRAVQETRGQILTFEGRPIKSFYHSTCGGHTEAPEKVWGAKYPYIRPVYCGFCNNSPRFNWAYSAESSKLEPRLRADKLLKGELISMRVVDRNSVGRASHVEVRGTGGVVLTSASKIRDVAGTLNVLSTDFTVVRNSGKFVFVGHGSGHGVGMCQWGAKFMGDKGHSYAEILRHYYPLAQLSKLY